MPATAPMAYSHALQPPSAGRLGRKAASCPAGGPGGCPPARLSDFNNFSDSLCTCQRETFRLPLAGHFQCRRGAAAPGGTGGQARACGAVAGQGGRGGWRGRPRLDPAAGTCLRLCARGAGGHGCLAGNLAMGRGSHWAGGPNGAGVRGRPGARSSPRPPAPRTACVPPVACCDGCCCVGPAGGDASQQLPRRGACRSRANTSRATPRGCCNGRARETRVRCLATWLPPCPPGLAQSFWQAMVPCRRAPAFGAPAFRAPAIRAPSFGAAGVGLCVSAMCAQQRAPALAQRRPPRGLDAWHACMWSTSPCPPFCASSPPPPPPAAAPAADKGKSILDLPAAAPGNGPAVQAAAPGQLLANGTKPAAAALASRASQSDGGSQDAYIDSTASGEQQTTGIKLGVSLGKL